MILYYVPDGAQVRDKMLYASTRLPLLKALGSSQFTDSIFATSKADLTAESYEAHLRHVAAPNPLSSREKELADLKAAENAAASYEGSSVRHGHYGGGPGFTWSSEAEDAIKDLGAKTEDYIVILIQTVDPQSETLLLHSFKQINVSTIGQEIPTSQPSYTFLSWEYTYGLNPGRDIIFIYSCPSDSPVKHRMVYASGALSTLLAIKDLLGSLPSSPRISARRIETSEPTEVNEAFLKLELGLPDKEAVSDTPTRPQGFAKPKGPPRRR
ncbi:hypothetical protein CPB83DRAFT_670336 [Crepidotus variabilis]|uniref:ADF-H domain-containing protein n=1 Tax=Crepidotus variabilis TaxID=179855 RepID=A0A9P6ENV3_9AGAR|nr:hypothetical protein CPB83DRAFT_670336 [Crepidotus variabilis]